MCSYLKCSLLVYSILFKGSSLGFFSLELVLLCSHLKLIVLPFFLERHVTDSYFMLFSYIFFIQEFWFIFSFFAGFQVSDVNYSCISICLQLNTHILTCMHIRMYIHTYQPEPECFSV